MPAHYDISNLQKLFDELEPKQRVKTIKGALRRTANKVKRLAIDNLSQCVNSNPELEKGIRALVWKKKVGFRVTVGTKKANKKTGKSGAGYYKTRKQGLKPVLLWLEGGTKWRKDRKRKFQLREGPSGWVTLGTSRGFVKRYGFMDKTRKQVSGSIGEQLKKEIVDNVKRMAKKYGCT